MQKLRFRQVPATPPARPLFDRTDDCGRSEWCAQVGAAEAQDCTVRALALAAGVSYADAHAACELYGRTPRKAWSCLTMRTDAASLLGIQFAPVDDDVPSNSRTVATWLRELAADAPPGRYLFRVLRHVFTVVVDEDGNLTSSDLRYVPRQRVRSVWRAEPMKAPDRTWTGGYAKNSEK